MIISVAVSITLFTTAIAIIKRTNDQFGADVELIDVRLITDTLVEWNRFLTTFHVSKKSMRNAKYCHFVLPAEEEGYSSFEKSMVQFKMEVEEDLE